MLCRMLTAACAAVVTCFAPAGSAQCGEATNAPTQVQIQLRALVTIKTGGTTHSYTCDVPMEEDLNVEVRGWAMEDGTVIGQLVFRRPEGFVVDGQWAPMLALTPGLQGELRWRHHLETPVFCFVPARKRGWPVSAADSLGHAFRDLGVQGKTMSADLSQPREGPVLANSNP